MRRAAIGGPAVVAAAGLLALLLPGAGGAYVDGPAPGHTGGFGQPTCRSCHFGEPTAPQEGGLEVEVEASDGGGAKTLRIAVAHPELQRAGFQLTARYAAGPRQGEQAGTLRTVDERAAVSESEGILYAHHTEAGTEPVAPQSSHWVVEWVPPAELREAIVLHAAANAANGDDSALGDHVLTAEVELAAEK